MKIKEFYDKKTATFSYVVCDDLKNCAIIDSVLDYDQFSGKISYESADLIIDYIQKNELKVVWILETHIHADHLTACDYLKQKFIDAKTGIGSRINEVFEHWTKVFNIKNQKNKKFDKLFNDGEKFKIGELEVEVMHSSGHTPACVCYKIEDVIFVGDVIFMPDIGTARTDFPDGSAKELYNSLQKIFALNDDVRIFTAHDYPPSNRQAECVSTVFEQKEGNIMINKNTSMEDFIAKRQARDAKLATPNLLYPSLQVNIFAGKLPEKEENGINYIKIPITK